VGTGFRKKIMLHQKFRAGWRFKEKSSRSETRAQSEPAHSIVAPAAGRSWARSAQHWLGTLVEIPVALLVAAEIGILFAGVVARYALHRPLVWSDELASVLFLWLAMLGAVVAFRRNEHMRMTAIVAMTSPGAQAFLDLVATCAALAFLLLIAWPAFDYAHEESFITTPALEIANAWRAAALPVGTALMILFALLRLVVVGSRRAVAGRWGGCAARGL
jgi:TRAP-type C4-dicarboxylate transport system permease small subunit